MTDKDTRDTTEDFVSWLTHNRYIQIYCADEVNNGKWYISNYVLPEHRVYFTFGELYDMYLKEIDLYVQKPEGTLKERALRNELNCKYGVAQIMYVLASEGVLVSPYAEWSHGSEPKEDDISMEAKRYYRALAEVSELLVMFNDEIHEGGVILGD